MKDEYWTGFKAGFIIGWFIALAVFCDKFKEITL